MSARHRLCPAEEIAEAAGKGFTIGEGRDRREIFVIRKDGALRCYVNSCPHVGSPLDLVPDRFFAGDHTHLMCFTHGALFRADDGFCVRGPCRGLSLEKLAIEIEDGAIVLVDPPAEATRPAAASSGC
ncbi:MAG: Rieske (2Fe-2S) protein [Alphaproteobacteria bacterium]